MYRINKIHMAEAISDKLIERGFRVTNDEYVAIEDALFEFWEDKIAPVWNILDIRHRAFQQYNKDISYNQGKACINSILGHGILSNMSWERIDKELIRQGLVPKPKPKTKSLSLVAVKAKRLFRKIDTKGGGEVEERQSQGDNGSCRRRE